MADLQYIYIGSVSDPSFAFDGDAIAELSIDTAVDMIGQELSADQFTAEVFFDDSDGALAATGWATPISYFYGSQLIGRFYSKRVLRVGKTRYRIEATSAIGILDYQTHYGGLWNGSPLKDVVRNIILTDGVAALKKGYYTSVHRGNVGQRSSNFDSSGFVVYGQSVLSTDRPNGIRSVYRVSAKFTLNKCLLNELATDPYPTKTSVRLYLLGAAADKEATTTNAVDAQYGIYMDISRASTSDSWPDYGEVFLGFASSAISLGTPTGPTVYDVYIYPNTPNYTIINGVRYSVYTAPRLSTYFSPIGQYACGLKLYDSGSSDIACANGDLYCDVDYEYYRIYDAANNLISDFAIVENYMTGQYNVIDLCTVKYNNIGCYYCEVDSEDYVENADPTTYSLMAGYPGIVPDDFNTSLLNLLSYGNDVGNIPVYGWADVGTKRSVLHQLLFSQGLMLQKNDNGSVILTSPSNNVNSTISADRMYESGSAEKIERTNRVEVTEYSYYSGAQLDPEVILDNENPPSGVYYAIFKAKPVYSLVDQGEYSVLDYNCNAAIVSGAGQMTGKPYLMGKSVIVRDIDNSPAGKTVSVTDATLITEHNSDNLADRLAEYYSNTVKIKNAFVLNEEKCGLKYQFTNPFGEVVSGFLTKSEKRISSIIKSNSEFVCGYNAANVGTFDNYVILTGSGTWTVPASVFEKDNPRIRVVLISGGQGGSSGYAGEAGDTLTGWDSAAKASGGDGGASGACGKIYTTTITNPAASYSYQSGLGGAGGAISYSHSVSNPGSYGSDSTLSDGNTTYSTANGYRPSDGYTNIFTGQIYAKSFYHSQWNTIIDDKLCIGKGGDGGYYTVSGYIADYVDPQIAAGIFAGEDTSYYGRTGYGADSANVYGGAGGGGAVGTIRGGNGTDATNSVAGSGGIGADATAIPPKMTDYIPYYYGWGGCGGYGGGGGGCSGLIGEGISASPGNGGAGGYGGAGGAGGDGCILIYY